MPLTRSSASPPSVGFIFQFAASSALSVAAMSGLLEDRDAGSSLPSMYSSVAPPPVETWEKPESPSESIAATVSPPPTKV